MKKVILFIIIALPTFTFSGVNAQTIFSTFLSPTKNVHYSSGTSGLCFGCSITDPENVADTSFTNYANIKLPLSLFASAWIRMKLTGQGVANEKVGIVINEPGGLVSSTVLATFSIRTYQNGVVQETVSGSGLTAQLLPGSTTLQTVHFDASKAFNEVRFSMSSFLFYQNQVNIFYAYTDAVPLPVELVNFSGAQVSKDIVLDWKTASESNNSHFTVEKSINGYEFYEIGDVDGAGNSVNIKSYTLTDNNVTEPINYYRLKQVDLDGAVKTYKTIVVKYQLLEVTANTPIKIKLYPNPASDYIILSEIETVNEGVFSLYDTWGEQKINERIDEIHEKRIGVHHLEDGVYIWRVTSANGKVVDSGRVIIRN